MPSVSTHVLVLCVNLLRDKSTMTSTPILSAMLQTIRYHLGTIAKGSFIITLVKIPRLILTYISSQLKGKVSPDIYLFQSGCPHVDWKCLFSDLQFHILVLSLVKCWPFIGVLVFQENACARCMLKACICCLWCLEKCLAYLNQVRHF